MCFLGRLAPFAALALVLFSSLFFLSIFLIFLIFQCLHRAGHRAGVGVFFLVWLVWYYLSLCTRERAANRAGGMP